MAAPRENLLSIGHLTSCERNTFTRQREHCLKKSTYDSLLLQRDRHLRAMHLQQQWQHLKEREHKAQEHNRLLLLQFDKAQDTLREMLSCNAAMKNIRMEYEKYLEERVPEWQQQFKKKSEASQMKKMEDCLSSYLKKTEAEQMAKSPAGHPSLPQKVSAPQGNNNQNSHTDHNQEISYLLSTWLTHLQSQTACLPFTEPGQHQGSSHVPPAFLPPPSTFPHPHHLWPRQDPPDWASPQPDLPRSWTAGAPKIPSESEGLCGQLNMEESPCEREICSHRERVGGGKSSHLSQELDINPVRLCSGHVESSDSGRDFSQAVREKRKKKTRHVSSDQGRCSSEESSRTSRAMVTSEATKVQRSESSGSSQKSSTRGSKRTKEIRGGSAAGSSWKEEVANQTPKIEGNGSEEESFSAAGESVSHSGGSTSEDAENKNPYDQPEDRKEKSESVGVKLEHGVGEMGTQKSEQSSAEEEEEACKNNREGEDGDGEERVVSLSDEEQEGRPVEDDDDEVPGRKSTSGEEEETGTEDEMDDQGDDEGRSKDEHGNNRKEDSSFSQDEEVDESDGIKTGEEEESDEEEEEEQKGDKAEEDSDSDDSIISPQVHRPRQMHVIPEEAAEEEDVDGGGGEKEDSITGSSDQDSIECSDDDIENLLAPQEQTKKVENKQNMDMKPKASCDYEEISQVEQHSPTKSVYHSDSDEFDHFYD
ncbi:sarcoplasmic reticulum histidine-rich calcium-binding protein-like [Solea solea]|uniref:sarcoplasmic reticulum histidine-rich calcium-binding protein-like n=1 Tax=Solea solea TaxID=90069 RepID=UPI00272D6DEA|nr:sarcoplasmic reticulum histidine-rich calcium-binding protein-like [Solea solea]